MPIYLNEIYWSDNILEQLFYFNNILLMTSYNCYIKVDI